MGRNVTAHGTPDRSFAGLMDHLTGFNREGASGHDPVSDFGMIFRRNSRPDSAAVNESLTNVRNGERAMLPVTERKPGRATPRQDAAALSYEQALRIHNRRRTPQVPAEARNGTNTTAPQAVVPLRKNASSVRNAASNGKPVAGSAKAAAAIPRTSTKTSPQPARMRKMPSSAPLRAVVENHHSSTIPKDESRTSSVMGGRSGKQEESSAVAATGRKKAAAAVSIPKSTAKGLGAAEDVAMEARNHPKPRRKAKPLGKPHRENPCKASEPDPGPQILPASSSGSSVLRDQVRPLNSAVGFMEVDPSASQLSLLHELNQLDQRRTIVSVRLTEGEFACLRDRAEESGISVSAYMRSCVVDAEQLRAQVKRALAEMRSLSAPDRSKQGMALTAAGHRTGEHSLRNPQGWFRMALRPLVLLFGPLFPARRSA